MICEAHRRTHRHSMVRWTVTAEWKWESVFFYMRFDVCTDPEPKEAESLETDLNADSSLFCEWCVWVWLMLQQHLYKTEDGSEQWHTHTDRVAECVLPPSLDSKVLISIKNPDVLKTRQPDWSWPILLLPVRFPAAFFHSSLLSEIYSCAHMYGEMWWLKSDFVFPHTEKLCTHFNTTHHISLRYLTPFGQTQKHTLHLKTGIWGRFDGFLSLKWDLHFGQQLNNRCESCRLKAEETRSSVL